MEGFALDTAILVGVQFWHVFFIMGMGIAFLPALYAKSEIRDKKELRVTDVEGINVVRNHALVWRNTSPVRNFYKQLAEEIREIIESSLGSVILPASHSRLVQ